MVERQFSGLIRRSSKMWSTPFDMSGASPYKSARIMSSRVCGTVSKWSGTPYANLRYRTGDTQRNGRG
eukprot:1175705-Prorocentrum_minimum.AAC.4